MTDTLLPPAPPAPASPASPAAVLGVVADTIGDLTETLWAARTPAELLGTVRAAERLRSVLDAMELSVVAQIEATRAAATEGWASTKDYLTAVTGGRTGEGRRLVALARALDGDRAATGRALAAADVSRTQAQVIVTAVDRLPSNPALRSAAEALLIEAARTRTASDLATIGAQLLERLDPEGTERRDEQALDREERAAHHHRFLSLTEDGLGGIKLTGRGTVEDAALLKAVLLPLAAPHPAGEPGSCGGTPTTPGGRARSCGVSNCAHDGRDPREHGTRMWDALIDLARHAAATGTDLVPTSHGTRPRIGVTITLEALRTGLGTGTLETGETLSAAAVRRLACDAEILPYVLGSRSQILDVGRTSRLVTLGLWLALLVRDRHCAFPGCTRPPAACDAHHIQHWANGGPTALHNLVLLCRTHHTTIHTTPWQVRLNPHDHHPEFLPPSTLDPEQKPLRHRPLRE